VARADATEESELKREWTPEETWVEEPLGDQPDPDIGGRAVRSAASAASAPVGPASRQRRSGTVDRARQSGAGEGAGSPTSGSRRKVPKPVVNELEAAAGEERGAKLAHRMADATNAYEKERYQEARRILKALADEVPDVPAVRELYGLVLYRLGQWSAAAKQLEAFRQLTGSFDQHPVLADCYRALDRFEDADAIWAELREASPSGDLVAEGRIVAAGCRADQGDLEGAIAVLEKSARRVTRPQDRHLRQWYALADLYERAGDVPRARELFARVDAADPDAFDVRARLRALR
jgi:tetratricopeptide (TPR) repeat protein